MSLLAAPRHSANGTNATAGVGNRVLALNRAVGVKRGQRRLRIALLVADASALVVALLTASALRVALQGIVEQPTWTPGHYVVTAVALVVANLALFRASGLYDFDHILAGTREYALITHAVTYGIVAAVAISYFAGGEPLFSRSWLLFVWAGSILTVGAGRFIARRVIRKLRRRGQFRTRVIVVGASTTGVAIAAQLRASTNEGIDVVGFLDEYVPLGQRLVDQIEVIGRPDDLLRGRFLPAVDEYVLVPSALPHERLDELTRLMVAHDGPTIRLAVSPKDLLTNGVLVAERGSVPTVTVRIASIPGIDAILKRTLDVVGAALGMLILWPVAVGYVLLEITARGWRPLVAGYWIRGQRGQPVRVWLLNREVCHWMLVRGAPALLDVILGKLSLVGFRPELVNSADASAESETLLAVRPGLTGPWRLADDASADQELTRDLQYIRSYSIWEDFRILYETARRTAKHDHSRPLLRWAATGNRD